MTVVRLPIAFSPQLTANTSKQIKLTVSEHTRRFMPWEYKFMLNLCIENRGNYYYTPTIHLVSYYNLLLVVDIMKNCRKFINNKRSFHKVLCKNKIFFRKLENILIRISKNSFWLLKKTKYISSLENYDLQY